MTHLEPSEDHLSAMVLSASQYHTLRDLSNNVPQHLEISDEELENLLQRNLIERHGNEIFITPLGAGFVRAMNDMLKALNVNGDSITPSG